MKDVITEQEREKRISDLHKEKAALLDKYGVFGGGRLVNKMHQNINEELEELGVPESGETLSYSDWVASQTTPSPSPVTWEELESRALPWTKKESLKEWGDMGYLARCKYESYEAYDISRHESLLLEYIRKHHSLYPLHPPMEWVKVEDRLPEVIGGKVKPVWGFSKKLGQIKCYLFPDR